MSVRSARVHRSQLVSILFLAIGFLGFSRTVSAQAPIPQYLRDVARYNAPYVIAEVYQGPSASSYAPPQGVDHLLPVDFDGDTQGANNADHANASYIVNGQPSVYYSIAETGSTSTDGYFFIGYYFYHPQDQGFAFTQGGIPVTDVGHAHDMEGIFLVVKKSPYSPYGWVVLGMSEAHGALIPYYRSGWVDADHTLAQGGSGSWGGVINFWNDPDFGMRERPVVAIRAHDHGTYLAQAVTISNIQGNPTCVADNTEGEFAGMVRSRPDPYVYTACVHDGTGFLLYKPAVYDQEAVRLPNGTSSGLFTYALLHVPETSLWQYRDWGYVLFGGNIIQIAPTFRGYDSYYPEGANPPWQWRGGAGPYHYFAGSGGHYYSFTEDGTPNYHWSDGQWPSISYGALLGDPGAASRTYFPGYSTFGEPTVYNAYQSVPPPCCQALNVDIAGPDVIASGLTTTWTAMVSGGSPPYTYQWTGSYGTGTGQSLTANPMADGTVYLDVWDAVGAHLAVSKSISVTGNCGGNQC